MGPDVVRGRGPGLVLALVGIVVTILGLRAVGASYTITRWPVAPGRVIRAFVDSLPGGRYRPHIYFEAYLAGEHYVGSGITRPAEADDNHEPLMDHADALAVIQEYPLGRELLVGFDPLNPNRMVLYPRFNWLTLVPVFLGSLALVIGIQSWRATRRTDR